MHALKISVTLCLIAVPPILGAFCPVHHGREMVSVLVAKRNLAEGTVVNEPEKLFVEKYIDRADGPTTAVRAFDAVHHLKLRKAIAQGECVTEDHLWTDADTEAAIKAIIPPG